MSWLIESYMTETKEANKTPEHDHPGSWNMKNKWDFDKKEYWNTLSDNSENGRKNARHIAKSGGGDPKYFGEIPAEKTKYGKSELAKKANEYQKKAVFDPSNNPNWDDSEKEKERKIKAHNDLIRQQRKYRDAADAKDRHDRRHPDRAVKESVSNIVELLQ